MSAGLGARPGPRELRRALAGVLAGKTAGAVASAAVGAVALSAHALCNAALLRRAAPDPPPVDERVSLCVPARDEAARIGPCVRALLASTGLNDVELLVLDDASADGTSEVAQRAFAGDARAKVITGRPLPAGWLGKPHACAQLAEAASGRYLVFVDADVVVAPHAVAAAIDILKQNDLSLVSPYPRQVAASAAERLVQPLLQWLWLTFLPLRIAERHGPPSMTAANGQFLVMTSDAYRRCGGHAGPTVRAAVVEDVWLARACKATGGSVAVIDGTDLAECRMYDGWQELRDGYTKSLWAAFGGARGATALTVALTWLYVLPPGALLAGLVSHRRRLAVLGAFGAAGGAAGRLVAATCTGARRADALAHPVSIAMLLWLTWRSVVHRRLGRLEWKGRSVTAPFGPQCGLAPTGPGGARTAGGGERG